MLTSSAALVVSVDEALLTSSYEDACASRPLSSSLGGGPAHPTNEAVGEPRELPGSCEEAVRDRSLPGDCELPEEVQRGVEMTSAAGELLLRVVLDESAAVSSLVHVESTQPHVLAPTSVPQGTTRGELPSLVIARANLYT